jgi:phosphatidate cytidylyltransferase
VRLTAIHAGGVLIACVLAAAGAPLSALCLLPACALAAAGASAGTRQGQSWKAAAFAPLYIGLPCVAMIWLRGLAPGSFEAAAVVPPLAGVGGFEVVLWLLLSVWATDTGSYVCGRLIGGPQMAPRWSPQKTWSGLIGGLVLGVAAALAAWALLIGPPGAVALAAAVTAAAATQTGDVLESVVKRRFGVKDAGDAVPGHGGVLDRLDGLLLAALAAAAGAVALHFLG